MVQFYRNETVTTADEDGSIIEILEREVLR